MCGAADGGPASEEADQVGLRRTPTSSGLSTSSIYSSLLLLIAQIVLEQLVDLFLAQRLRQESCSHRVLHRIVEPGEAPELQIAARVELVARDPCLLLWNARHCR